MTKWADVGGIDKKYEMFREKRRKMGWDLRRQKTKECCRIFRRIVECDGSKIVDIDARDGEHDQKTALMYTVEGVENVEDYHSNGTILRELLDVFNPTLSLRDVNGKTALRWAQEGDGGEELNQLLEEAAAQVLRRGAGGGAAAHSVRTASRRRRPP